MKLDFLEYIIASSFVLWNMEDFKEACGLPDIMADGVMNFLYISSAVSKDWHSLYESVFGQTKRGLPKTEITDYWAGGMQFTHWDVVDKLISETDFTKLTITALKASSEDMKNFAELMAPAFDQTQYDIPRVIKAYLVVHQPTALFLLDKVLNKRLDLDTKLKLKKYCAGTHKPNYETLKLILSYVK